VLQLEELERVSLAERQIAATLMASGRYEVAEPPRWAQRRQDFDEWLVSEPEQLVVLDVEERELRQVLGVG
jgi:hypothetical protein